MLDANAIVVCVCCLSSARPDDVLQSDNNDIMYFGSNNETIVGVVYSRYCFVLLLMLAPLPRHLSHSFHFSLSLGRSCWTRQQVCAPERVENKIEPEEKQQNKMKLFGVGALVSRVAFFGVSDAPIAWIRFSLNLFDWRMAWMAGKSTRTTNHLAITLPAVWRHEAKEFTFCKWLYLAST